MANGQHCAICGKATGTFMCRGCSKDFCLRHTNEHRQDLNKQMDEDIIPLHDQLRQNINEQTNKFDHDPLMKQIDEWEQTSIEKIRQTANDARQQLLNISNKHIDHMKETLEHLTQQLKKARDDDCFFESQLKEWKNKLDALKKDLVTPQIINIQYDDSSVSFVSKILISDMEDVSDECFEQPFGDILITNDGTVITHNQTNNYASVRGRREYTFGKHRLRFVIENLSMLKWIFVGIVSKNAPTLATSSIDRTGYGFSGVDNVWCNGDRITGLNGYKSDFETNDTIELVINCDQQMICLINERTQSSHILDVDISYCPFPWKLSVGLFHCPGDRIRILL